MREQHNIDDLLKSVNGTLIAEYECRHLRDGGTLKSINEEYLKAIKNAKVRLYFGVMIVLLVCVTSFYSEFMQSFLEKLYFETYALAVVGFCIILKELYDWNRPTVVTRCVSILKDFRKAVAGLNPLSFTVHKYTQTSVRDILVTLAERKLYAEMKFDAVRLKKVRWTEKIVETGIFYLACDAKLEDTLEQAKDFGLEFKNNDLFADAKKRMDIWNE